MSQSFTTDRRRVQGLGGAKHGAGTWVRERLTGLALIPLGIWGLCSAARIMGTGYAGAADFVHEPTNALFLILLIVCAIWHMKMGLVAVIDDYIEKPFSRGALLLLNLVVCIVLGAAAILSILKVAFGAAFGI